MDSTSILIRLNNNNSSHNLINTLNRPILLTKWAIRTIKIIPHRIIVNIIFNYNRSITIVATTTNLA
jgi:hypothetical protein